MMGIEESEDEDHDSDAVGDEGELGVVVNTLIAHHHACQRREQMGSFVLSLRGAESPQQKYLKTMMRG
jgi:hypothetical protein